MFAATVTVTLAAAFAQPMHGAPAATASAARLPDRAIDADEPAAMRIEGTVAGCRQAGEDGAAR